MLLERILGFFDSALVTVPGTHTCVPVQIPSELNYLLSLWQNRTNNLVHI